MAGVPREHSSEFGKEGLMRRLLSRRRVTESGCWEYTRSRNKDGYGTVTFKGVTTRLVPRIAAWLWLDFDLGSGLKVCHRCDNPPCFNPDHLFTGTSRDNMRDSLAKGRFHASGEWQKRITHCPHGHPYSQENTYWHGTSRVCRMCRRIAVDKCQKGKRKRSSKNRK